MSDLSGTTTIVVGASRGLGRGVATAFAEARAPVVVVSSGAALAGSPLSGGYAGAKATQRFITGYAQDEAKRAGLDLTFTAVFPRMTPLTGLGQSAARAYAARTGQTEEEYLKAMGPVLTPEIAGAALVELVQTDAASVAPGYLLTGAGLQKLP